MNPGHTVQTLSKKLWSNRAVAGSFVAANATPARANLKTTKVRRTKAKSWNWSIGSIKLDVDSRREH